MEQGQVQKYLDDFRKYVITQSKSNLSRLGKNNTRSLYNSIKGTTKAYKNSVFIEFEMLEYGQYIDKGVKGKNSSFKSPNSPFRFGSGTGKKGGLTKGIQEWVKQKRFQFKDKQGKFMSYNSTAWLITRSIYSKGIKPSLFFTKPFEKAFKKLPKEIAVKYGLDIKELFIQEIKKND